MLSRALAQSAGAAGRATGFGRRAAIKPLAGDIIILA